MQDAPKTGSLRLEALLDELSQLRIANAERQQELGCLNVLQEISPREEVPVGDSLQQMIDLVPYGFLSPKEVSVQVRISEHVFSTPGFQSAQESHSTLIYWDEQEVGELLVQVTGQTGIAAPIPREKQRFLSLVADRFGECIQVWSMMAEAETSKQRLTELDRLTQEVEEVHEIKRRLRSAVEQLSVSIMEIWDGVLFVPMAGILDSRRASELIDTLYTTVFEKEPYFVILDIKGVEVIDTTTALYILRVLRGLRLLGVTGMITGIRPVVAATIVIIGIDLSSVLFYGTLRDGLRECIRRMKAIRRMERLRQTATENRPVRK